LKKKVAGRQSKRGLKVVNRLARLFGYFELDGPTGFPLSDRGAIDGVTVRGDIFNL